MPALPSLNNYKPQETGNKLQPGEYDLVLENLLQKTTYAAGEAVIAEFLVEKTYSGPHEPGEKASYVQSTQKVQMAGPALTSFMIALLGCDYKSPEGKAKADKEIIPNMDELFKAGFNGAFKGRKVHDVVMARTSKPSAGSPSGNPYTVHAWSPAKT